MDDGARKYLTNLGYGKAFTHRLGHGIGLETHEQPYLRGGSKDIIQSGHAFSNEPGVYIEGQVRTQKNGLNHWFDSVYTRRLVFGWKIAFTSMKVDYRYSLLLVLGVKQRVLGYLKRCSSGSFISSLVLVIQGVVLQAKCSRINVHKNMQTASQTVKLHQNVQTYKRDSPKCYKKYMESFNSW